MSGKFIFPIFSIVLVCFRKYCFRKKTWLAFKKVSFFEKPRKSFFAILNNAVACNDVSKS